MTLREVRKRAGGYARFSTSKQDAESIEDQQRLIGRFCEQKGFDLVEQYADAAMSASTIDRPDLRRLLDDVMSRKLDVVVVESLDRLSRDMADLPGIYRRLKHFEVELYTVDKGLVDETLIAVSGITNASQLDRTSKQTWRDLEGIVLKGRFAGGRAYGYRKVLKFKADGTPVTGEREPDPDQVKIVERIFREYGVEGRSLDAIVHDLTIEGVPGPSGGPWYKGALAGHRKRGQGILNNELYVGVYVWNRRQFYPTLVELGDQPKTRKKNKATKERPRTARMRPENEVMRVEMPEMRILPQELWDAVKARQAAYDVKVEAQQKKNGGKNKRAGIGAVRRNLTLLADVLHCGECGGRMTSSGGQYMRCVMAHETGGAKCTNKRNWRRDHIEGGLLDALHGELMSEEALRAFMTAYNAEVDRLNKQSDSRRRAREADLGRLQTEIGNVLKAVRNGVSHPSILAELDRLEKAKAEIEAELAEPAPQPYAIHPNAASLYRDKIANLATALKDPETGAQARESVRDLLESVTLTPAPERGKGEFDLDVEGALGALLQAAGVKHKDAASIDAASRPESSGQLVAGARNRRCQQDLFEAAG